MNMVANRVRLVNHSWLVFQVNLRQKQEAVVWAESAGKEERTAEDVAAVGLHSEVGIVEAHGAHVVVRVESPRSHLSVDSRAWNRWQKFSLKPFNLGEAQHLTVLMRNKLTLVSWL